jgi:hypothetical protein
MNRASATINGDFACEVLGMVTGSHARWGLSINEQLTPFAGNRILAGVANSGALYVSINGVESEPFAIPILKKGANAFNTLLVVVHNRVVEVYVNGVAVCDPVALPLSSSTPHLFLSNFSDARPGSLARFQRVTIWSAEGITPVEQRGAKVIPAEK